MNGHIPVNIAVEDPLSEAVVRRVLGACGGPWAVGSVYGRSGVGYLRRTIAGFNLAARGVPFVVLADLDRADCAPSLLRRWLPHGAHANLVLRFAVREVEAWVLADARSLGSFLAVQQSSIPEGVDLLEDPKRELVRVARGSRRREIVADVVPLTGSTAVVGRNYNARLIQFVDDQWSPGAARRRSDSLNRMMLALESFAPTWA
jgi:hypothetical protein